MIKLKWLLLILVFSCQSKTHDVEFNSIIRQNQLFYQIQDVSNSEHYDTLRYSKFAITPILTLSDKIVYIDTLDGELKDLSIYIEQTYGYTVTPRQIFSFWNKYPTLEFKDSLSLDSANLIEFRKLVNHERILLRN